MTAMDAQFDTWDALALLDWQVELGADEAIGDVPLNRYEDTQAAAKAVAEPERTPPAEARAVIQRIEKAEEDWLVAQAVPSAERMAAEARDLSDLRDAMAAYEFCELKKGAKTLVFADGNPAARLMIVGEAPGRDEDIAGRPFVGRAGQLLDRMLAAIGLSRTAEAADQAVYIANVIPWRPPQNRDPSPDEIAMMLPFLKRHVDLVNPDVIVPMGNIACQALLGQRGILRLRGTWAKALGRPALPMTHPAYLLRTPAAKREAWADLLDIQARLKGD
jgi:uracil-DNA glycosylase family 4